MSQARHGTNGGRLSAAGQESLSIQNLQSLLEAGRVPDGKIHVLLPVPVGPGARLWHSTLLYL